MGWNGPGITDALVARLTISIALLEKLSLTDLYLVDQSFDSPGNGFDTSKMYPAIAEGLVNKSWVDRACASKCYFVD